MKELNINKYKVSTTDTYHYENYIIDVLNYHTPEYEPIIYIHNCNNDNVIAIDHTSMINVELNIDNFNNDLLIPIKITNNTELKAVIYRQLNNGSPINDNYIYDILDYYLNDKSEHVIYYSAELFEFIDNLFI